MFVYLIVNKEARLSYRGVTVNLARRLRQHRGEIVNGAKYTRKFDTCTLLCFIGGFESQKEALSFEWYTKKKRTSRLAERIMACMDRRQKYVARFCHTLFHPKFAKHRNRLVLYSSLVDPVFKSRLVDHYGIQVLDWQEKKVRDANGKKKSP